MRIRARHLPAVFALPALAGLNSGCRSFGPATVAQDRFDYSSAITESWKRQTLLNIVKIRYLDPPIFVDVGQIVAGYQFEGFVGGAGGVTPDGGFGNLGLQGRYIDRPTITYTPLTGAKFVSALVTPIPPAAIFQSIQAGWPADIMLKLGVNAINGLRNPAEAASAPGSPGARFERLLTLLRQVQDSGELSIRVKVDPGRGQTTIITLHHPGFPRDDTEELRALLNLSRDTNEFQLASGTLAASDREIAVQSRSLLHVIGALALHVDLPEADVAAGRAMPGSRDADPGFRVHSGPGRPADAFVAINYRHHWFWIDDRDLRSKRAFAFILLLFTMSETSSNQPPPVLTIPTG